MSSPEAWTTREMLDNAEKANSIIAALERLRKRVPLMPGRKLNDDPEWMFTASEVIAEINLAIEQARQPCPDTAESESLAPESGLPFDMNEGYTTTRENVDEAVARSESAATVWSYPFDDIDNQQLCIHSPLDYQQQSGAIAEFILRDETWAPNATQLLAVYERIATIINEGHEGWPSLVPHEDTAESRRKAIQWPEHQLPGFRVIMLAAVGWHGVGRHDAAKRCDDVADKFTNDEDAFRYIDAFLWNELADLPFPIRDLFGIDKYGHIIGRDYE